MLFDRKARVGYEVCRELVLSRIHVAVFYVSSLLLSYGYMTPMMSIYVKTFL
jgi:hypothetical protein